MLVKVFVASLVLALLCVARPAGNFDLVSGQTPQTPQQKIARYSCPMHPDVVRSRPGKCRKCGMKLRLVKTEPATTTPAPTIRDASNDGSAVSQHIPNVPVFDQNGKRLKFYSDLVKGKTVAINFIFTTCTTICPPMTATFRRVQQQLGERAGRDVYLISVSVDPVTDVPERLHDFAAKFNAGPGWTFVTGSKTDIDSLLQALGVAVTDKNDHTPMILVGNDTAGYWTRAYGLSPPTTLVNLITAVADRK